MALKWWIKIIHILKKLIRDIKIIFVIIYYKNLKTVNNELNVFTKMKP